MFDSVYGVPNNEILNQHSLNVELNEQLIYEAIGNMPTYDTKLYDIVVSRQYNSEGVLTTYLSYSIQEGDN
jgi:hypothetical protein